MWFIDKHDQLHFPPSVFAALPALGKRSFANGRVTHCGLASGPAHLKEQSLPTTAESWESASSKMGKHNSTLWCDNQLVWLPSYWADGEAVLYSGLRTCP